MEPHGVEDWLRLVPHLFTDGWQLEADDHGSSLSSCPCPWGGELLRIHIKDIYVQSPPKKKSCLLMRPEARALCMGTDELLARGRPGEALVRSTGFSLTNLIHGPAITWQQIRRDLPQEGDGALSCHGHGVIFTRPRGDAFDVVACFQTAAERGQAARALLERSNGSVRYFLNRPGIAQLRCMDESFYVILMIRSCRRGLPLIPSRFEKCLVTIRDGEGSWPHWDGYESRCGEVDLAEYVQLFRNNLGMKHFQVYSTIDGCRLVRYQCAIARRDWDVIKGRFYEAFLLQKKAYRHAYGGSTAPCISEDVEARWRMEKREQHQVVVRHTFLEVDECIRPSRRHKTTGAQEAVQM